MGHSNAVVQQRWRMPTRLLSMAFELPSDVWFDRRWVETEHSVRQIMPGELLRCPADQSRVFSKRQLGSRVNLKGVRRTKTILGFARRTIKVKPILPRRDLSIRD